MSKKETPRRPEKDTQLKIDLKRSIKDRLYDVKRVVSKVDYRIRVIPYWRNGVIWFSLIGIVFSTSVTGILLNIKRNQLPDRFPLLYSQDTQQWLIVSKDFVLFYPILFGVASCTLFYFFPKTFYINKRLTLALTLSLFFSNMISIVAMLELIFMVTN